MDWLDLIERSARPLPWAEGEKIPWNEPGFSERMLKEHLSQAHDAASRKAEQIDRQVQWMHAEVLKGQPAAILDLGCGPGLYLERLARLGHTCTGIDFSPASITYASRQAAENHSASQYRQDDLRSADFGSGYDLALLIYGEFNTFRPAEARDILKKAHAALRPGGSLLLEVHTLAAVEMLGSEAASWYTSRSGLFSVRPHLCLQENFWYAQSLTAVTRFFVADLESGAVTPYGQTLQGYADDAYQSLLEECGYEDIRFYPSLTGKPDPGQELLFVIESKRRDA